MSAPEGLAEAHALRAQGRHAEAVPLLDRATRAAPGSAEAWIALGSSYFHLSHFARARRALECALALAPDFVEAWLVLGNCRVNQGDIDGAMAAFEEAHRLRPDSDAVASSRLFYMAFHPEAYLRLAGESTAWGAALARTVAPLPPPPGREPSGGRLRIGYLSHEFGVGATAYFFEPVLARHDRARVETFLYATSARDATGAQQAGAADHWRDIGGLDARGIAERVRADAIDILVLVTSYRAVYRRPLAYKPAPIQVCYSNLVSTTGLGAVDYLITEEAIDPSGTAERQYVERLVRLTTRNVYAPPLDSPPVADRPSAAPVTFGCFNNIGKITRPMAALWARVLAGAPGATLLIKSVQPMGEAADWEPLRGILAAAGVPLDRVECMGTVPTRRQHLEAFARLDIALDPFPFNGGTSSCDALWMGVPVVTRQGETFGARQTAAFLAKLGLAELVATTADAYVEIALRLAADPARRAALRHALRGLMQTRLLDYERHVAELEAAYEIMWNRHCAGLPPRAFSVTR